MILSFISVFAVASVSALTCVVIKMLKLNDKRHRLLAAMVISLTLLDIGYLLAIELGYFFSDFMSYMIFALCLLPLIAGVTAAIKNQRIRNAPDLSGTQSTREKYGNNRLPEFVRGSIVSTLTEYMNCERPWLRVDLTLSELADAINVNSHHLSQIINSEFAKSFACYINEYRVQAACQFLLVESNKTVIDVAMASGFASKSSFNAVFKKFMGVTPSEYRRQQSVRLQDEASDDSEIQELRYGS